MNELVKKMFASGDSQSPIYFEALTGQLPQFMKRKDIICSGENSVAQKGFTGSPMQSLSVIKKIKMIPTGIRLYGQIKKSLTLPKGAPARSEILPGELVELENYLTHLGVQGFGYAKVDPDIIFKDRGILFDNALVISLQMPLEKILQAPSFETMSMIEATYIKTGSIVNAISRFLRRLGFGAQAGPGLGGMVNYPLLAQAAGLGEFGRSGLLISPQFGPSHRLAAVYTNIRNLPIRKAPGCSWIPEFCQSCGKCIKKCPNKAILEQPKRVNARYISFIDYNKCMPCFNANYGCSICVKVCPFTTVGYEKIYAAYKKQRIEKGGNHGC